MRVWFEPVPGLSIPDPINRYSVCSCVVKDFLDLALPVCSFGFVPGVSLGEMTGNPLMRSGMYVRCGIVIPDCG